MATQQFNFPTTIKYGAGAVKLAPDALKRKGSKRPLIVTDKNLEHLSFVAELKKDLAGGGLVPTVYAGVFGNPTESQVTGGVKAWHEHGADALVVVGGGAALDVGKAVALMVNHPGKLFDYEDGKPDARTVDQPIPYWIAIPTTSGTGSEVGRSSVIGDDETHAKKIIFDPKLLAPLVLADPELTYGLPAAVTAATGFDALTHCVEAFLAKGFHPICDGIALEGVHLAAQHLVRAVREPKNADARGGMMLSSMMGAIAFQKGLGVTHSCAHALSTVYDTHHGLANALMIDTCMRFNRDIVKDRLARLAGVVGLKGASDDALADGFIQWLVQLRKDCGLPSGLKSQGVKEDVAALVKVAVSDGCHPSNPRPVTEKDFVDLFKKAM